MSPLRYEPNQAVRSIKNSAKILGGAAEPATGQNFETYATCLPSSVERVSLEAKDSIPSVVVGGLIIGTISNGLNMLHIQTFHQLVLMGIDRLIGQAK